MKPRPLSRLTLVRVLTTNTLLLRADNRRRGFTIFPDTGNAIFIGNQEMVAAGTGALIGINLPPPHFCVYIHGSWVQEEIRAFAGVNVTVGILEVIDEDVE